MKFNKKLMKSHSDKYRMLQIPHSVATLWISEGIENVTVEFNEKKNCLIVRPVSQATGKVGVTIKQDPLPSRHFGFE